MLHRSFRCAAVVMLALTAGCFNYHPASVSDLAPGETVRAYLTREQARDLNSLIGVDGRELVGTVITTDGDGLLLEVRALTGAAVPAGRTLNQRVAVPMAGVLEIEERRLNGWKTALVAGGVTAAVAALIAMQFSDDENSDVRTPKPNPEALRLPWFRIGIPSPGGAP